MENTFVNFGGHKISAGKKYSTSEVKTGDVWIDGKPIYRVTLQGTQTTYSDAGSKRSFYFATISADTTIKCYGTVKFNNGALSGQTFRIGSTIFSNAMSPVMSINSSSTFCVLDCLQSISITSIDYSVTWEYTKA